MEPVPVASARDPRLAPFRAVADPERVRAEGRFVAEGRRVVATLLAVRPDAVEAIVVTPAARAALGREVDALPPDAAFLEVPGPAVLRALTGVRFHQGCLALARRPPPRRAAALLEGTDAGPGLWLGLEGVTDPDNVGTLFRTARAFGVAGVLVGPGCAHPLYRKALRTSLGTVLTLPFAEAGAWEDDLDALAAGGIEPVALTPREDVPPLDAVAGEVGARVAVLLGSEERGLSPATLERVRRHARIPMRGGVDSLNVAAAGAIALYALATRKDIPPPRR